MLISKHETCMGYFIYYNDTKSHYTCSMYNMKVIINPICDELSLIHCGKAIINTSIQTVLKQI